MKNKVRKAIFKEMSGFKGWYPTSKFSRKRYVFADELDYFMVEISYQHTSDVMSVRTVYDGYRVSDETIFLSLEELQAIYDWMKTARGKEVQDGKE